MILYTTVLLLTTVYGFGNYRLRIPNGDKVPDPCNPGKLWRGVGHLESEGGGSRNPFGVDFEKSDKLWTRLCRLDSDKDGMTNGEELGDPRCVWAPGMVPPKVKKLSHPGICDPWNSTVCQEINKWLSCKERSLSCPVLSDPDVKNITLKFPQRVQVPATETNYYCMIFDLPIDRDYHLVATQPVIDNREIVHHVLAFGCDVNAEIHVPPGPYPCGMLAHTKCLEIIGTWTVGSAGECVNPEVGFRLGINGYRKAALQIHWNNPQQLETLEDASGLRLYYTPNLRKNDAGMLVVGQDFIQLNPKPKQDPEIPVTITSICSSKCTKEMFQSPIYITSTINHMHYYGMSQVITLYRNGSRVTDITNDMLYSYDSPIINKFDPPIQVLPGDEIHTECSYRSPTKGDPICYGDGTQDEMCFGFITYYPIHRLIRPWCTTRKTVPSCQRHLPRFEHEPIDGCPWKQFLLNDVRKFVLKIMDLCYTSDLESLLCENECVANLNELRQHACLVGDIGSYVMSKLRMSSSGQKLLNAMDICDCSRDLGVGYCDRRIEFALIGDQRNKYCSPDGESLILKNGHKYSPGNTGHVFVEGFGKGGAMFHGGSQVWVMATILFVLLLS